MTNNPKLRKFPYPYISGLTICSDIDHTDTVEKFREIQSFMSNEIGIRFTNTFFPYHEDGNFSLLSGTEEDRDEIIRCVENGEIDAVHSFGELSDFNRDIAVKALEAFKERGLRFKVWIDHADSPSNYCKYRYPGKGDIPGTREYHADITREYGIKYIWTERLTNIIGQGVLLSPKAIFNILDPACPVDSFKTMLKTIAKIILSFAGSEKYNYFKNNDLLINSELRDKQRIYEFVRFNNYFKSPENGDSFEELYYLISPRVLNKLKRSGGYAVVYVHLGKNYNLQSADAVKTVNALKNLKMENESGNIYIDSTSKVLEYYLTHKYLNWSWQLHDAKCIITVNSVDDPVNGSYLPSLQQLSNITFYVPDSHTVELYCGNEKIEKFRQNPEDQTGIRSITIS